MHGDLERLAYEAALRSLDKQERLLEELRARAGVLLAASSVAVSFLGQRALADPSSHGLVAVALTSFLLSVCACVFVLIPRGDVYFSMQGENILGIDADIRDTVELHRRLTFDLDQYWTLNSYKVDVLSRACTVGASALVVEIVSLAALAGGILV